MYLPKNVSEMDLKKQKKSSHPILVRIVHLLIITSFIRQNQLILMQYKGSAVLPQVVGFCFVKCTGVKIKVNIPTSQKQHVQFDFLNHCLNFQERCTPDQIRQQIV